MYPSQHSGSQPTQLGDQDKAVINKLFGILRLAYPNFLIDKSDEEISASKRLWYSHLNQYRHDAIQQCAEEMITQYPNRAPTVGQFVKMLDDRGGRKPVERVSQDDWCSVCRAPTYTRHHEDVCIRGTKKLVQVTPEQVEQTKKMFKALR